MDALISSGWLIDFVLIFVVLEAMGLIAYRVFTGRGLAPASVVLMLLPGAFLLFALRAALADAQPWTVLGWLTAALLAHLFDLWRRWSATNC